MARTDRLYAITEYLRSRKRGATVVELAEHFDLTQRTIHRDLKTLRAEGVPIIGDPGRGGGLRLGRQYSMPPLQITLEEAAAMWLSIRLARDDSDLPWAATAERALDKVVGTLDEADRARFQALKQRILIGAPADTEAASKAGPMQQPIVGMCRKAFAHTRLMEFDYIDQRGNATSRRVEPHGLMVFSPLWYLLAFDLDKKEPRTFRIDRIQKAKIDENELFSPRDPRVFFPWVEELLGKRRGLRD